MARYGYARVSSPSQRDDSQLDALRDAGCERVWTDTVSGKLARRPQWDDCLDHLRAGDELVVTRLSRMARSVRHLTELSAWLDQHGIDLVVLKQGIDTTTPAGRFLFHVLGAMDEMLADLISEGTKEGLESARARGQHGGRTPKLTARQIAVARQMYDDTGSDGKRTHTVADIAETLHVSRKTIYRHLEARGQRRQPDKSARHAPPASANDVGGEPAGVRPVRAKLTEPDEQPSPQEHELRQRLIQQREAMRNSRCPTCGHEPADARGRWHQRQDLGLVWLYYSDPSCAVIEAHHCAQCQPHQHVQSIECPLCGDGPLVAGDLGETVTSAYASLPEPIRTWLHEHGWHQQPDHGLVCGQHHTSTETS